MVMSYRCLRHSLVNALWDKMKSAINMNCTRKPIHTTDEQDAVFEPGFEI